MAHDASMEEEYEAELRRIDHSGPHTIGDDERRMNREVADLLRGVLPIDDIHKVSDCDLIFRYLIACQWNVSQAAENLRGYASWRKEMRLNEVVWEPTPPQVAEIAPTFRGTDIFGHPVFYDKPDPAKITAVLKVTDREAILRSHFRMMEQGRRLQRHLGTDRASCVLDLSNLSMGIVRNTEALGLLKEMSKTDQRYYPENMRTMIICNSGWAFTAIYKAMSTILDERIKKKVQVMGGGSRMSEDMSKWLDMARVPIAFGGSLQAEDPHFTKVLQVGALPVGTPPISAVAAARLAAREAALQAAADEEAAKVAMEAKAKAEATPPPSPQSATVGPVPPTTRVTATAGSPMAVTTPIVEDSSAAFNEDDFHSFPPSEEDDDDHGRPPPSRSPTSPRPLSAPVGGVCPDCLPSPSAMLDDASPMTSANASLVGPSPPTSRPPPKPQGDASPPAAAPAAASSPVFELQRQSSSAVSLGNVHEEQQVELRLEVHRTASGAGVTTGYVGSQPVGQVNGTLVVAPRTDATLAPVLLAEIVEEAGHPFHKHFMILDNDRRVKFIVKQRKLHHQLQVFRPNRPDPMVSQASKLRFKCEGDTTHCMTVQEDPAVHDDKRDWTCFSLFRNGSEVVAKRGSFVRFQQEMASLPDGLLLAFAACVDQLWR